MRLSCTLSLLMLMVAGSAWGQSAYPRGGTLTYCEGRLPRTFDPITASEDMESVRLSRLLYEGLFQVDISKAVRPGIAQPTRFLPDGRRMSIALRSGLKWSDGGEITAQDVTSTFEAMRRATNRNLQTRVADIVSVQPTGTYDLLITFRSIIDRRNMPKLLAFPILPRHKLQELPLTVRSDIAVQPVGSGFYKFVGRDAKTIHLEANEQYRKRGGNVEGPYIDKINILHIPDAASQVDHIRLGKVDILVEVPPSQIAILNAEGMSLPDYESLSFEFLAINHTNPLLAIREVRQAMEYGFDRDNILTRVYQRKGTLVAGPFPPYLKSYSLDVPPFEYNPEKAIGLLTGAGFTTIGNGGIRQDAAGRRLEFIIVWPKPVGTANMNIQVLNQFISDMRKIGIEITPRELGDDSYRDVVLYKRDFDLAFATFVYNEVGVVEPMFKSTNTEPGQLNFISYKNKDVDALLDEYERNDGRAEVLDNINKRLALILRDDCPYLFLWSLQKTAAARPRVHNFITTVTPYSFFDYANRWYLAD